MWWLGMFALVLVGMPLLRRLFRGIDDEPVYGRYRDDAADDDEDVS